MRFLSALVFILFAPWPLHAKEAAPTFYRSVAHQFGTTAIRTSSTLPSQGATSYGPANLDDGDPATAWCEGRPGDGIGESVEIRLEWPQKISDIEVVNGYAKTEKSFRENNRVKALRLSAEGLAAFDAELADSPKEQRVRFPRPVKTSWVRLTIGTVIPGEKFQDTCLSEVRIDFEEHNYDQAL